MQQEFSEKLHRKHEKFLAKTLTWWSRKTLRTTTTQIHEDKFDVTLYFILWFEAIFQMTIKVLSQFLCVLEFLRLEMGAMFHHKHPKWGFRCWAERTYITLTNHICRDTFVTSIFSLDKMVFTLSKSLETKCMPLFNRSVQLWIHPFYLYLQLRSISQWKFIGFSKYPWAMDSFQSNYKLEFSS